MVQRYESSSQLATPNVGIKADAGNIGLAINTGIQVAGAVKRNVDERIQKREAALEQVSLNKAKIELDRRSLELENDLQTKAGPAGDGYLQSVEKERAALKSEIWSSLPPRVQKSESAQLAWDNQWTSNEIASSRRAIGWQQEQEKAYTLDTVEDLRNIATANIEANPDTAPAELQALKDNLVSYSGILTDDEMQEITDQVDQSATLATVRGLVDQERFEDADKLLNDISGKLNDKQREGLAGIVESGRREIQQAKSRQDAQIAKEQQINSNVLEVQILDGNAGRNDIDRAVEEGLISVNQQPALIRTLRVQQEKAARLAKANETISDGGVIPYDPYNKDHKDTVDDMWSQMGGVDSLKLTEEVAPAVTVSRGLAGLENIVNSTGIVPPAAASELQAMAINGNSEQKQLAYDTINYLYQTNSSSASAAFSTGDKRVMQDAISYQHKVNAGMSSQLAMEAVTAENEVQADPVKKIRQKEGFKAAQDLSPGDLRSALDENWLIGVGKGPFAQGAEEVMMSMYRQNYQDAYLRHGDDKLAKKQAEEMIKRVAGRTRVSGNYEFMAYPPEKFYPRALNDSNPDWMKKQLVSGVQELLGGEVDGSKVDLVSDATTAQQARYGIPSYAVMYNGEPLPQRFVFDATETVVQHNEAAQIKAIEAKEKQSKNLAKSEYKHSLNRLSKQLGAGPTTTREQRAEIRRQTQLQSGNFKTRREQKERDAESQSIADLMEFATKGDSN